MARLQQQPSRHDHYKLVGVKVTDRVLSYGAYTIDSELEYMMLKCVGKKIHQTLFMQGGAATKVRQLKEQCNTLSQIRHPNITMFLGLFFEQSPILVMEFIPYSLASCINQYGTLPDEVSYSILHSVALGLSYLHSQTPTIIHGELTANDVLLTENMRAKISYIGVPKILGLTRAEINNVALASKSSVYQPPEIVNSTCLNLNPSTDAYSFGMMIIHTLSGKQPNSSSLEITGLENLQASIDTHHPVMIVMLKCTNINPQQRPCMDEVAKVLREMIAKYPPSFAHKLEMLSQISSNQPLKNDDKREYRLLQVQVEQNEQQIQIQAEELKKLTAENQILRKQISIDSKIVDKAIHNLQQLKCQAQ